eukprot:8656901-Pyramimonas_sp.AAC.1
MDDEREGGGEWRQLEHGGSYEAADGVSHGANTMRHLLDCNDVATRLLPDCSDVAIMVMA